MDDFLDNQIAPNERRRLEAHLDCCTSCAAELRRRSALELKFRRAIGAAVQPWALSAQSTTRLVDQAHASLCRGIRVRRSRWVAKGLTAALAVALVLLGVSAVGRWSLPSRLRPIALLPEKYLALLSPGTKIMQPEEPLDLVGYLSVAPPVNSPAGLSLMLDRTRIDPEPMYPGEAFTITLYLRNSLPQPLPSARFDLEITGPSGYYRFPLTVNRPVPAGGVSLLQVTPDVLAGPCQETYLIPPTRIFDAPGVYRLRVTLFSPAGN